MKKIILSTFLLLTLVACGNGSLDSAKTEPSKATPDIAYLKRQYAFANSKGISLNEIKDKADFATWLTTQADFDSPQYIQEEYSLFSGSQYKLTATKSKYLYFGETKDNYADGFGVLLDLSSAFYNIPTLVYAGEFTEGRFDGYGLLFEEPLSEDQTILYNLYRGNTTNAEFQEDYYDFVNYVRYEGTFDEGKLSGDANKFTCALYYYGVFGYFDNLDNFVPETIGYSITVGEFKDFEENGAVRIYELGDLSYEGSMKNGEKSGKGIQYFPDGKTKKYAGEFKNGKYHGNGILYDETGKVLYDGKWKNGDYA